MVKLLKSEINLLKKLQSILSVSSYEHRMKEFLLDYINKHKKNWKKTPKIVHGKKFNNMILLIFGKPRTAVLAHMDEVGFMAGNNNQLFEVGNTEPKKGDKLYGYNSKNEKINAVVSKVGSKFLKFNSKKNIPLGTILSYSPTWRETKKYITSGGNDNCVGVLTLLHLAKNLDNGILIFTTQEETSMDKSLGSVAKYLYETYKTKQILIADVVSATKDVVMCKGPVVGIGIDEMPSPFYLSRITSIIEKNNFPVQLEISDNLGTSDFTRLTYSPYTFDMCFIGIPIEKIHSSHEKVCKTDISTMFDIYSVLMKYL